jgi:hypothetical protein
LIASAGLVMSRALREAQLPKGIGHDARSLPTGPA